MAEAITVDLCFDFMSVQHFWRETEGESRHGDAEVRSLERYATRKWSTSVEYPSTSGR